jgi:hypothetical protein
VFGRRSSPRSAAKSGPAGLRTPGDPAKARPRGRTHAEEVGSEDQNGAVTWPDVWKVVAAIGRFFIRFFGGG